MEETEGGSLRLPAICLAFVSFANGEDGVQILLDVGLQSVENPNNFNYFTASRVPAVERSRRMIVSDANGGLLASPDDRMMLWLRNSADRSEP
jgi:hypothetical protein